jgi:hypothetical protein
METDAVDGGKRDQMRVRDLDGYGVEIGRVVQAALITIATRTGDRRRLRFSTGLQT